MKNRRFRGLALALSLALLQLSGCARAQEASESSAPPSTDAPAQALPAKGATSAARKSGAPAERKLVREGELSLEVDSVAAFRAQLETEVNALGGHVMNGSLQNEDGQASSGQFTLRLPQDKLASFAEKCRAWGTVTQENLRTREITAEYYDERARLTNAQKLERRLLALVDESANSMKDLLEVERELARVREQIETLEGRLRLYDDQVTLATLVMKVTTRERFVAAPPQGFMAQAGSVLGNSAHALAALGRGSVLLCVALLPWLPLGAGLWLLARTARRRLTSGVRAGR
jgi:hypothetical protein